MADGVQVNPEARTLQVAAPPAPSSVALDERSRITNWKPAFYATGRIVEKLSKLYGYAVLIAGISSIFLSGISSLPLTKWDNEEGVPHADVVVVNLLPLVWIGLAVSNSGLRTETVNRKHTF